MCGADRSPPHVLNHCVAAATAMQSGQISPRLKVRGLQVTRCRRCNAAFKAPPGRATNNSELLNFPKLIYADLQNQAHMTDV